MKAAELREQFLYYFEGRGHTLVPSSSLVPRDPTLFFTNAGMVQFKGVFVGEEKKSYKRATSSQKCMRVSGKHNDLENVGRTPRHHTFFEMLGNFSFGDYFKKEAIAYAWEFLTKTCALSKDRLCVTVFRDDDEAAKLWTAHVPKDRIFRLGEDDNFWAMGDTGPCGPCSEILYDWEPAKKTITEKDILSDRFWEVWNLVFMQFNRSADGKMTPLAKPSIDTGMGLERIAAVVQGKKSNYDTDLFTPIIVKIEEVTRKQYAGAFTTASSVVSRQSSATAVTDDRRPTTDDVSIRVIADHIRAAAHLIADGVQPSNEGRGYVLRRIMRRAIRHGKMLGMNEPFFAPLAHVVIDEMGTAYPELVNHRAFIEQVIQHEEERFYETLEKGLGILQEGFAQIKKGGVVPGELVFRLYDTYGFPKDLTADIAAEHHYTIDEAGFETLMDAQREKARAAWKGSGEATVESIYKDLHQTGMQSRFVGYEQENSDAKVLAILHGGKRVSSAAVGDEIEFVTDSTPFYGEGGGQVGDSGMAVGNNLEIEIVDTRKPYPTLFIHRGRIVKGKLGEGARVTLAVDSERRAHIRRNHTATHLLHKALRSALGEHVKQAGSLVAPDRLRFDFSHFASITHEQLAQIEAEVNDVIRRNIPLSIREMAHQEAVALGAMAYFGEKYGNVVRVVEVPDYSMELCGGTHVRATGDIGMCKIVSQGSIAAGVRRIEAITGKGVEDYLRQLEQERAQMSALLKVGPAELATRVIKLAEQVRTLEKELAQTRTKMTAGGADITTRVREVNGVRVLSEQVDAGSVTELRSMADQYRQKIGSGIVTLGAVIEGKASLVVMLTNDLTTKYDAGKIMQSLAKLVGGTGGGRADMAQGGGPDGGSLSQAISKVEGLIS